MFIFSMLFMDKRIKIIQKLASNFHEKWRENRLNSDGTYISMIEKSEDKEWNIKH